MAAKYSDTPLSLIPTPSKQTGETDEFTMNATQMAIVHNVIILGYNSIYQQAPRIKPVDVRDFVGYSLAWIDMVIGHHHSEEAVLFPLLEAGAGVPGLMDTDKEEHVAFYGGMDALKSYLNQCLKDNDPSAKFSGTRVQQLMDEFGPAMHTHLKNEVPHLASLKKYPNIDMATIKKATEKDSMDRSSTIYDLPMLWYNLDVDFEDGRWKDFPGLPAPVRWVMVNVLGWWRSNWWRFGSVDRNGKRVQLLALRDDY